MANKQISEAAKRTYHVGRLDKHGNATFAFNIRRRDDGGIGLSKLHGALTDTERSHLFAHFGSVQRSLAGGTKDGESYDYVANYEPGTEEQFVTAVHSLPHPFCLLASEG